VARQIKNGRRIGNEVNGNGNGMHEPYTKAKFPGKLVILGCGSIGQGILPMLLRHTDITSGRMRIITADEWGRSIADQYGIEFIINPLTPANYVQVLKQHLSAGDFLLNLSVDVSYEDLLKLCQKIGVLYLDTSAEFWPGFSADHSLPVEQRTNYAYDNDFRALQKKYTNGTTAIINHGANPGLVSHFIKAALLDVARDVNRKTALKVPSNREGWARLMRSLNIRVVQIAERDTQVTPIFKRSNEFVNTWSIEGFLSEAVQPAEFGWGVHEKELPTDGHLHSNGANKRIIYLDRPGGQMQVRSWTPREGAFHAFLITHEETMTTSSYYTVVENEEVVFSPTVMYAYHPCDDAVLSLHEYAWNNWRQPQTRRLIIDDIERGSDELGVLLMGHKKRSYWYGSDLSIAQARERAPNQNATTMQVAAGALAGLIWALENPRRGICEPEDLDYERVLDIAMPYLGTVHGKYTNWTPLHDRKNPLFPQDVDADDCWQFKNFRVT